MKKLHLIYLQLIFLIAGSTFLQAQTQTLELSPAGLASPATGPSTAAVVPTFTKNTTGSTFVAYTPATTVTATLSGQTYSALSYGSNFSTGVFFGGRQSTSGNTATPNAVYALMNIAGSPTSGLYTSSATVTPGSGIDVAQNSAIEVFTAMRPMLGKALNAREKFATLTLTFNRPIKNTVLHIVGLGGNYSQNGNAHGHTTELELQTAGVTLNKLSGNSEFVIDGTNKKILNNGTTGGAISAACGSGAACGTVEIVSATDITTLVFDLYAKGDGWELLGMLIP